MLAQRKQHTLITAFVAFYKGTVGQFVTRLISDGSGVWGGAHGPTVEKHALNCPLRGQNILMCPPVGKTC